MAFKFVLLAGLLAVSNAALISVSPQAYGHYAPVAKAIDSEYDANPEYNFSYDVHDSLTGDAKTQQESRHGDVVEGRYSLIEADGSKRTVHYTADPVNGFNAVVEKEPAQIAVKTVQPVVHAAPAPLVHAAPAPLVHAAPAPLVHAAPVIYKSAPVYQPQTAYKIATPVAHAYAAPYYQH